MIYGPGQDINRLIPYVIKNCIENNNFPCSTGLQYRDFIYIDDAINLIFKSLIKKKIEGEIFNICSGKPVKVKQIINFIKRKINKGKPKFGLIPLRKDEVIKFYGNPSKTKKFLNWKTNTNIQKKEYQKQLYFMKIILKREIDELLKNDWRSLENISDPLIYQSLSVEFELVK